VSARSAAFRPPQCPLPTRACDFGRRRSAACTPAGLETCATSGVEIVCQMMPGWLFLRHASWAH
jgi:hypothetical protein